MLTDESECKNNGWLGTLECRCLRFTGQGNWSQRKETGGTYSITGHKPMLTTSENNYKRSLFSFQRSCINQIVTQSIGIHLKRKMRAVKKQKTNLVSAQVRKTSSIVHSGFKTIKNLQLLHGLCSSAVSRNHSGEAFSIHQCFLLSAVRRKVQTGATVQDLHRSVANWSGFSDTGRPW